MVALEHPDPAAGRGLEKAGIHLPHEVVSHIIELLHGAVVRTGAEEPLAGGWGGEVDVIPHAEEVGVLLQAPSDVSFEPAAVDLVRVPVPLDIPEGSNGKGLDRGQVELDDLH